VQFLIERLLIKNILILFIVLILNNIIFTLGKTVFFSLWIKVDWVYRIARRKNKANILAR